MVSIGDMLLDAGLTRDRLEECRGIAATNGESLDRVILTKGYMEENTLLQIYAKLLGYEFLARYMPVLLTMSHEDQTVRLWNYADNTCELEQNFAAGLGG